MHQSVANGSLSSVSLPLSIQSILVLLGLGAKPTYFGRRRYIHRLRFVTYMTSSVTWRTRVHLCMQQMHAQNTTRAVFNAQKEMRAGNFKAEAAGSGFGLFMQTIVHCTCFLSRGLYRSVATSRYIEFSTQYFSSNKLTISHADLSIPIPESNIGERTQRVIYRPHSLNHIEKRRKKGGGGGNYLLEFFLRHHPLIHGVSQLLDSTTYDAARSNIDERR